MDRTQNSLVCLEHRWTLFDLRKEMAATTRAAMAPNYGEPTDKASRWKLHERQGQNPRIRTAGEVEPR